MAVFEREGLSLAYDDEGSGTPIVFLHGLSMSRRSWDRCTDELTSSFRVVRLDQRGHGESSHAPGTYVLDTYLADTIALLEQVVGEPSILVGHSLGGVIAHGVAQTRPDLALRVLLEDPPLYVPLRMTEGETREQASSVAAAFPLMQELARDMQARNAPVDEWAAILARVPAFNGHGMMADVLGEVGTRAMAEAFTRVDPEIFTTAIEGTAISGAPDLTQPLACPVVVLRADPALGPAFTTEDAELFMRTNPSARVVVVEGASHQIHDEQPVRFVEELSKMLTNVAT